MMSDLFKDFPTLRFIIPHGGGAVPFHWGRFRGIAQDQKRPPLPELMRDNVFFDTCVYHQPGIDLLLKVVPIDNILFASEMVGAVRGVDPETGHYYDDTKRYIDGVVAVGGRQAEDLRRQHPPRLPQRVRHLQDSDPMQTRKLGPYDVTAVGFGCMNLSHAYGPPQPRDVAERVLRRALDLGVTHFDTAALYGFGANEKLVGEVLGKRPTHRHRRQQVRVVRPRRQTRDRRPAGIDPRHLRGVAAQSARPSASTCTTCIAGTSAFPSRTPSARMADLKRAGKIRAIGLSEVGAATLRRAHAVHPIAALQSEYSLWTRNPGDRRARGMPPARHHAAWRSARWGAGFSPAHCAAPRSSSKATSAARCRASRARISRKTRGCWRRWTPSPPRRAVREPNWRSPGCCHEGITYVVIPGTTKRDAPGGKLWCGRDSSRRRNARRNWTRFCPRGRPQEPGIHLRRRSKMTPKRFGQSA